MVGHRKRPRDPNQLGKLIIDIARDRRNEFVQPMCAGAIHLAEYADSKSLARRVLLPSRPPCLRRTSDRGNLPDQNT
jgi:hypothetical protein